MNHHTKTIKPKIFDACYWEMPIIFNQNANLSIVLFCKVKLPLPEYFVIVNSVFHIKCFKDVNVCVEQSGLH